MVSDYFSQLRQLVDGSDPFYKTETTETEESHQRGVGGWFRSFLQTDTTETEESHQLPLVGFSSIKDELATAERGRKFIIY